MGIDTVGIVVRDGWGYGSGGGDELMVDEGRWGGKGFGFGPNCHATNNSILKPQDGKPVQFCPRMGMAACSFVMIMSIRSRLEVIMTEILTKKGLNYHLDTYATPPKKKITSPF